MVLGGSLVGNARSHVANRNGISTPEYLNVSSFGEAQVDDDEPDISPDKQAKADAATISDGFNRLELTLRSVKDPGDFFGDKYKDFFDSLQQAGDPTKTIYGHWSPNERVKVSQDLTTAIRAAKALVAWQDEASARYTENQRLLSTLKSNVMEQARADFIKAYENEMAAVLRMPKSVPFAAQQKAVDDIAAKYSIEKMHLVAKQAGDNFQMDSLPAINSQGGQLLAMKLAAVNNNPSVFLRNIVGSVGDIAYRQEKNASAYKNAFGQFTRVEGPRMYVAAAAWEALSNAASRTAEKPWTIFTDPAEFAYNLSINPEETLDKLYEHVSKNPGAAIGEGVWALALGKAAAMGGKAATPALAAKLEYLAKAGKEQLGKMWAENIGTMGFPSDLNALRKELASESLTAAKATYPAFWSHLPDARGVGSFQFNSGYSMRRIPGAADEVVVYWVVDKSTGQVLKVGDTTVEGATNRWTQYVAKAKAENRQIEIEYVRFDSKVSRRGPNDPESLLRKEFRQQGNKLPWDREDKSNPDAFPESP